MAKRKSGCICKCNQKERVTRELDAVMRDSQAERNPIEERLTQCPEAFKAGELIEKMFNAAKFGHHEILEDERLLPPPGTAIPPLV